MTDRGGRGDDDERDINERGDDARGDDDAGPSSVSPWSNAPAPPASLGLERGTVALVAHREDWHDAFERERDRLRDALGADAVAVEHVGSTAVCGLPAKAILDIAVGVSDLKVAREHRDRGTLGALGYEYRANDAVEDRLFFARGPPECRTHYLSLTPVDGSTFREQVAFRDALRTEDARRDAYADLKRDLATAHGDERDRYTAEKTAFVEDVLASDDVTRR